MTESASYRPRVSLIVPCYNAGAYVEEALASALGQLRAPDEIIVVDDGSTDGSAARIAPFGSAVRYHLQPNLGPSAARNRGVELSSGDVIAFLDADDLWLQTSLRDLLQPLDNPGVDLSYGRVLQFFSPELRDADRRKVSLAATAAGRLPGATLVRRTAWDAIGGFDQGLPACEMVEWMARAERKGIVAATTDSIVLKRRIHATNSSRRQGVYVAARMKALRAAVAAKRAIT